MYDALDIARYVVNYCNQKGYVITNLRLQKLLYFIQGDFIASTKSLCFEEPIECWQYGPVVRNVYLEFKSYGAESIDKIDKISRYNLEINSIEEVPFNFELENEEDKEYVTETIDFASNISTKELVDITHNQMPWHKNYVAGIKTEIPVEDLYAFFGNAANASVN